MTEEMEMPTPCIRCGEWFNLHDGGPSQDGRFRYVKPVQKKRK